MSLWQACLTCPVSQHKFAGGQQMLQLFNNCFLKLLPCCNWPVSIETVSDWVFFICRLSDSTCWGIWVPPAQTDLLLQLFCERGSFTNSLFQGRNGDSLFNTTSFMSASFLELPSLPNLAYLPSTTSAVVSDKNLCWRQMIFGEKQSPDTSGTFKVRGTRIFALK